MSFKIAEMETKPMAHLGDFAEDIRAIIWNKQEFFRSFHSDSVVKNLSAVQEMHGLILGLGRFPEEGKSTHSHLL